MIRFKPRPRRLRLYAALACAALVLSACGNDPNAGKGKEVAAGLLKSVAIGGKAAQAAAPANPMAVIAKTLAANDGPLIMAVIENQGRVSVMGPSGQNGPYRTWAAADRTAFSFNRGVLTSTRGLGDDLMASENEPSAVLISSRQAGQAERSYQHLTGLGYTRQLSLNCDIAVGAREKVAFAEVAAETTMMTEICQNGPLKIQNLYWVSSLGDVIKSRQWISGTLGYITTQQLRL